MSDDVGADAFCAGHAVATPPRMTISDNLHGSRTRFDQSPATLGYAPRLGGLFLEQNHEIFRLVVVCGCCARAFDGKRHAVTRRHRAYGSLRTKCDMRAQESGGRRAAGEHSICDCVQARAPDSQSHLYPVDLASRDAAPLVPTMAPDARRSLDPDCAPPQSFRTLITHGPSSRSDGLDHGRLYVANHGGSQSLEMLEWHVRK